MKVMVYYTVLESRLVEVDDKYEKIINDDWYDSHYTEARNLMRELDLEVKEAIEDVVGDDAEEIVAVWSEDDQTVFYEN